jgi:NADH:ubiquinone oxidoreductase subunit F (NADH-binding)
VTRPLRSAPAAPAGDRRGLPLLGAAVHYPRGGTDPVSELEPEGLAAHERRHGPRPSCYGTGGHDLLTALDSAGLTGRGGGHFPAGTKWRRVRTAGRDHPDGPIVVANGAEGEPLSRKDSALLELRPHLVLDGLACAAEAVGADEAIVWLHAGAHYARSTITRALAERAAHRPDEPRIRVAVGPDHYLTGESSAVVRGVSGGPARPGFARVPAAQAGVHGRPTLVQNVDTLARVARLARGDDPGTVLLTLSGRDHLVVDEFPVRTTLRHAVTTTLGASAPQALLVGGYGGRWIPWSAATVALHDCLTRCAGPSIGAGVVHALPAGYCGLQRTAVIAGFLADSSARQCGPCRFGLPAIAEVVSDLARTRARRRDSRRLERFLTEVSGRGACHHPDGAVGLVRSALDTFAEDVAAHLRGRCLHTPGRRG